MAQTETQFPTTTPTPKSHLAPRLVEPFPSAVHVTENVSAANSAVNVTTVARAYPRRLRSIGITASASATCTVTVKVRRKTAAGTADIDLANLDLSAQTNKEGQYSDYLLAPDDVVVVDAGAGGVGVVVTVQVVESSP